MKIDIINNFNNNEEYSILYELIQEIDELKRRLVNDRFNLNKIQREEQVNELQDVINKFHINFIDIYHKELDNIYFAHLGEFATLQNFEKITYESLAYINNLYNHFLQYINPTKLYFYLYDIKQADDRKQFKLADKYIYLNMETQRDERNIYYIDKYLLGLFGFTINNFN